MDKLDHILGLSVPVMTTFEKWILFCIIEQRMLDTNAGKL